MPTTSTNRLQEIQSKIAGLTIDATDSSYTREAKTREKKALAQQLVSELAPKIERLRQGETNFATGQGGVSDNYQQEYPNILKEAQDASKTLLQFADDIELPDFLKQEYGAEQQTAQGFQQVGQRYSGKGLLEALSRGEVPGFSMRIGDQTSKAGDSFQLSQGGALTQFEKAQAKQMGTQTYEMDGQSYAFDPVAENQKQRAAIEGENATRAQRGMAPIPLPDMIGVGALVTPSNRLGLMQNALNPNEVGVGTAQRINEAQGLMGGQTQMQVGSTGQVQVGTKQDVIGNYRGVTNPQQDISLHRGSQEYGKVGAGQPIPSVISGQPTPPQGQTPPIQPPTVAQNAPQTPQISTQTPTGSPTATTPTPAPVSTNPIFVARREARVQKMARINQSVVEAETDLATFKNDLKADPALNSAYSDLITLYDKMAANIQETKALIINSQPTDAELEAELAGETTAANAAAEAEYAFEEKVYNLKAKIAEDSKESKRLAYEKANIIQQGQIRSAQTKRIDDEVEYRRTLGVRGLENNTYQLERFQRWMDDADANINDMISVSNLTQLESNLATVNDYSNSLNGALLEWEQGRGTITAATNKKIKEAKTTMNQSKASRKTAIEGILKWETEQVNGITEKSITTMEARRKEMKDDIAKKEQDAIDKEERAIRNINSLLDDYPMKEVSGIVSELGKDVKSFNVEKLLTARTKEEIKAAQAAAAARQFDMNSEFMRKSKNAPVITYDEFINNQVALKEEELGVSMTEESRQEYLKANEDYFSSRYDQLVSPTFENITSGNPLVDAATDAFLRGDLTIASAASAYKVSQGSIAMYAGVLREQGAEVGDIRALQPEQAKELSTLRKAIDDNDITKKINVMDSAIPKIGVARSSLTGVGDVALLNFYQNGIVDPGLAVRAEDATLLRKASALADKITVSFAESVLLEGAFFPDETRAEMERIAKEVLAVTERIYKEKVYTPTVEQAAMSGIGEAYFQYKARKPSSQGSNADDLLTSNGY